MKSTIEETTRLLLQGTLTKDEADKILLDLHSVRQQSELLHDFLVKLRRLLNFTHSRPLPNYVEFYLKGIL